MGVEPGEVVELPLLHIFQTWQVPKQHILVTPLSWPPKVYIDLYKVYLTIYTVLCCGASVFWIRKKILGKVYCCVRYQPQYQCVRISSDSTCTRRAVLSLLFGRACQHHRTTDCACSAAGLWWGCPVLVDNRESDLRKALNWLCCSLTHSVMAGWMKPEDCSSMDKGNLGTRNWVGSVSVKALEMKTQMKSWGGNGMALEALRLLVRNVRPSKTGACERNRMIERHFMGEEELRLGETWGLYLKLKRKVRQNAQCLLTKWAPSLSEHLHSVHWQRQKCCGKKLDMIIPSVLDLCGKALVAGVCRCGFCEKLLEASHVSSRPSASPLQDGPAAGQGCTPATHGGSQWVRVVPEGACQDCAGQKLIYRWHYLREVVRSRGHFFPLYFYFFHIVFCVRLDFNAQGAELFLCRQS